MKMLEKAYSQITGSEARHHT